jgi:hypothetical protein
MHKKIILVLIMITTLMIWMVSCTKQSANKIAGNNNTCDTTKVSYSTGVVPIIQTSCYGCHGNGNSGGSGGIVLEGYSNLSGWAHSGYLVGNVTHANGYVPMPYDAPMLPACEVNTIVAWVNQGALNN